VKAALVLVIGSLVFLPAAVAAPARTARLSITDLAPFTVHGTGFAAGERVVVTVSAKQRVTRRVVAGVRGTFTVRFVTVSLDHCSSYVVRAVGNRGSTVVKKVVPSCPVPATEEPAPLYPNDPTPKGK
jgi:hypothetical protein